MTVDRSYLPYYSARHYQDRKMAKWMGFFLSEHTTALTTEKESIDYNRAMPLEEKLVLLQQLYSQGLTGRFSTIQDEKTVEIIGTIDTFQKDDIGIQGTDRHYFVAVDQILSIQLEEGLKDEG